MLGCLGGASGGRGEHSERLVCLVYPLVRVMIQTGTFCGYDRLAHCVQEVLVRTSCLCGVHASCRNVHCKYRARNLTNNECAKKGLGRVPSLCGVHDKQSNVHPRYPTHAHNLIVEQPFTASSAFTSTRPARKVWSTSISRIEMYLSMMQLSQRGTLSRRIDTRQSHDSNPSQALASHYNTNQRYLSHCLLSL